MISISISQVGIGGADDFEIVAESPLQVFNLACDVGLPEWILEEGDHLGRHWSKEHFNVLQVENETLDLVLGAHHCKLHQVLTEAWALEVKTFL